MHLFLIVLFFVVIVSLLSKSRSRQTKEESVTQTTKLKDENSEFWAKSNSPVLRLKDIEEVPYEEKPQKYYRLGSFDNGMGIKLQKIKELFEVFRDPDIDGKLKDSVEKNLSAFFVSVDTKTREEIRKLMINKMIYFNVETLGFKSHFNNQDEHIYSILNTNIDFTTDRELFLVNLEEVLDKNMQTLGEILVLESEFMSLKQKNTNNKNSR